MSIDPCPHQDCGQRPAGLRQVGEAYRLRPCGHYVGVVGFIGNRVELAEPQPKDGRP